MKFKTLDLDAIPHPIFAGFIDYYFLNIMIALIMITYHSIINGNFNLLLYTFAMPKVSVLILFAVVIYHKWLCKHIKLLSLGEILAGKQYSINQGKHWINEYAGSRGLIFVIIVCFSLMLALEIGTYAFKIVDFTYLISAWIRVILTIEFLKGLIKGNLNSLFYLSLMVCFNVVSRLRMSSEYGLSFLDYFMYVLLISALLGSFWHYSREDHEDQKTSFL